jgi:hypothetical protein
MNHILAEKTQPAQKQAKKRQNRELSSPASFFILGCDELPFATWVADFTTFASEPALSVGLKTA